MSDYLLPAPSQGSWEVVLDSDAKEFGGLGRQDPGVRHETLAGDSVSLYLLPRTAMVLKKL